MDRWTGKQADTKVGAYIERQMDKERKREIQKEKKGQTSQ